MIPLGFPGGSAVKNPPAMQKTQETQVQSLSREDPPEKGMATHSSILAWRIPWTEEPGLQSIGSQSRTPQKGLSTHACTMTLLLPLGCKSQPQAQSTPGWKSPIQPLGDGGMGFSETACAPSLPPVKKGSS